MKTATKKAAKKVPKRKPVQRRARDEHGLTTRERKFADLMIPENMAAGRAYEQAGYPSKGGSANTQACHLLKNPHITAYIKGERRKAAEANQIQRWEVVGFLARVLKTPVGELRQDSDIAQEWREETVGEMGARTVVKMPDKIAAAKQLCQMLGWNEPEKHIVKYEVVIGPDHNE